jgi:hypothetical protein
VEHQSHLFSRWVGTAFVVTGVAVNLLSMRRHLRLVSQLNELAPNIAQSLCRPPLPLCYPTLLEDLPGIRSVGNL